LIKLSDYIIKKLEETGVKHMFMLPGGGAMHLNDSLGKSEKIEYICCLHEQACSIAAEAYARVNNTLGLLMVTTGPGGTNALTGIAGAFIESTPVFCVSGQVKRADMINNQGVRQQGMQEVDIISIVKPITKYAALVDDPQTIRYHIERALYEATNGRKGPVWLDIPLDVQATMIDEESLEGFIPELKEDNSDLEEKVIRVIDLINNSERPVLLAGNGIRMSGGTDVFEKLINTLKIPVLTTWNGIDLISEDDPLYFGRPGGLGHRYANFIQQNSDLFLSVGARLNLLQTGYNFDGFAREAKKVIVDIDNAELHKVNVRADLPICADAREFINLLLKHADMIKANPRTEWFNYANRMKSKYPIILPEYKSQEKLANTYCLVETIADKMNADDIYVSGSSGSCIDISMQAFKVKKGQRVFCTKGLAAMGYGLPSTIGACLAGGKRKTVSVIGDGGFMMNIQELETLRRLRLPVKLFVLCNHGYGAIQATQTNIFNKHFVGCNAQSGVTIPPIAKVAESFGVKALVINSNSELDEKIQAALDFDGPIVIEVHTPIELTAKPKQVSYKRKDGQMESLPLEYMNPMISDEEMQENMIISQYKMN